MREHLDRFAEILLPPGWPRPYWILTSDYPPRELLIPAAGGFTARNLDLAFEAWLEERGLWRGRAPCVVLDDSCLCRSEAIRETDFVGRMHALAGIHRVAAFALHELAHVADHGVDLVERAVAVSREQAARAFVACRAEVSAAYSHADRHSPSWLRCAAHAHYRIRRAGYGIRPGRVFARSGGTPHLWQGIASLGDELPQLTNVPLSELHRHPMPTDYVGCWRFTMNKWFDKQRDKDAAAVVIAAYEKELPT